MLRAAAAWIALFACAGCISGPHSGRSGTPHTLEHDAHCARATMGVFGPYRMPLAEPVSDPEDMRLLDVLPPEARRTARAAGLEPLLVRLIRAHGARASGGPESEPLLQQELTLRLLAFDSQVSALTFEIECTRRLVSELAADLDSQESDRQFGLAASSLVIGAGTGVFAGAWTLAGESDELANIVAIGGSIVTAALGTAVLIVPNRGVALEHRQNVLQPIQVGKDPDHLYPSFVFRMLTAVYANDPHPPRDGLLQDFEHSLEAHVSEPQRPIARRILFGVGGSYSRALLETRRELFQLLQSAVQGVARDLELLNRFLVRLLATPATDSPAIDARL